MSLGNTAKGWNLIQFETSFVVLLYVIVDLIWSIVLNIFDVNFPCDFNNGFRLFHSLFIKVFGVQEAFLRLLVAHAPGTARPIRELDLRQVQVYVFQRHRLSHMKLALRPCEHVFAFLRVSMLVRQLIDDERYIIMFYLLACDLIDLPHLCQIDVVLVDAAIGSLEQLTPALFLLVMHFQSFVSVLDGYGVWQER